MKRIDQAAGRAGNALTRHLLAGSASYEDACDTLAVARSLRLADVADALRCPDITGALAMSANSDSKLVILVGKSPRGVREAGESTAVELGWRSVMLNAELGMALRELMPSERPDVAWELLLATVGEHGEGAVLIGTDLLWEPSLQYDPYRSLRRLGRRGPLVATWFGRVDGPDIIRAEPGHPEYTRDRLDVPYVLVE